MRLMKHVGQAMAGFLALTGCSGTDILNFTIPRSGYTVQKDITYGMDPRQKLDVYVPDKPDASHAVILFFYGGSWQFGSKDDYKFAGQAFASRGYITVIADYRLYPQVYFPAFLEDGAQAFTWVHQHIAQYGGNVNRLFLAGHSAGAYIAVMLTVNGQYITAAGGDPAWIKGAIGIAGPYDFLPFTDPKIKAIFSKAPDADTQPIHFAHPGLPPILLEHGDDDDQVGLKNTVNLAARLRELHDPVTTRIYPGVGHIGIALALANGFRGKAPALDDADAFIREALGPKNLNHSAF